MTKDGLKESNPAWKHWSFFCIGDGYVSPLVPVNNVELFCKCKKILYNHIVWANLLRPVGILKSLALAAGFLNMDLFWNHGVEVRKSIFLHQPDLFRAPVNTSKLSARKSPRWGARRILEESLGDLGFLRSPRLGRSFGSSILRCPQVPEIRQVD